MYICTMEKYKYESYNYNFLKPTIIDLGDFYKDCLIESVEYDKNTNTLHINYRRVIDRITVDINLNDIIDINHE